MQRFENLAPENNAVIFLQHPSIFMVMMRHLTPASMAALMTTAKLSCQRLAVELNNERTVLNLLASLSRKHAAQFIQLFRPLLSRMIDKKIAADPDNMPAHAIKFLISDIQTNSKYMQILVDTIAYLKENHFPQKIIDSLEFIAAYFVTDKRDLHTLLTSGKDFYINLRNTDLQEAVLNDGDMTGADIYGAMLYEIEARNTNLMYADMRKSFVTRADFTGARMHKTRFDGMIEEYDYPQHPKLDNVTFFRSRQQVKLEKALNYYQRMGALHDFLVKAIANDLIKTEEGVAAEQQKARLESAMHIPIFARHSDFVAGFISKHLFTVFTPAQRIINEKLKQLEMDNSSPDQQAVNL